MSDLLERQLFDLATRLDTDDRDVAAAVMARIEADAAPGARRPRLAAHRPRPGFSVLAAAALVIIATVLAVPGPRHAVAHWFGIGSTRIERTPTTPAGLPAPGGSSESPSGSTPASSPASTAPLATFPAELELGRPVSAAEASASTGLPVSMNAELGSPAGVYVSHPPARGQVIV